MYYFCLNQLDNYKNIGIPFQSVIAMKLAQKMTFVSLMENAIANQVLMG